MNVEQEIFVDLLRLPIWLMTEFIFARTEFKALVTWTELSGAVWGNGEGDGGGRIGGCNVVVVDDGLLQLLVTSLQLYVQLE